MSRQIPESEMREIREFTIDLYLKGYSYKKIMEMVKEKFGKGHYYALNVLMALPKEYKEKRKEALAKSAISEEEKQRIASFAIELYLNGYSIRFIKRAVKKEFGRGVFYAIKALTNLPEEYRRKHLEAYLYRVKEILVREYGEELGLIKFEQYKKSVLEKGVYPNL